MDGHEGYVGWRIRISDPRGSSRWVRVSSFRLHGSITAGICSKTIGRVCPSPFPSCSLSISFDSNSKLSVIRTTRILLKLPASLHLYRIFCLFGRDCFTSTQSLPSLPSDPAVPGACLSKPYFISPYNSPSSPRSAGNGLQYRNTHEPNR